MMNKVMRIGILAQPVDFKGHQKILAQCETEAVLIQEPHEMEQIDGLIITGSNSSFINMMTLKSHWHQAITQKTEQGMPVFGISQGMIMLAKDVGDSDLPSLRLMDIKVLTHGYGPHQESFKAGLIIDALGKVPFPGVFIKAPYVEWVKPNVGILSEHEGKIVMVRQGNFLGAAFRPELADDLRVHLYFKQMIEDAKG